MIAQMTRSAMKRQAGVTLMELMIAVTLLSLLSVGLLFALRVGLTAYAKTQTRLMDNRRVAGAQRIFKFKFTTTFLFCDNGRCLHIICFTSRKWF